MAKPILHQFPASPPCRAVHMTARALGVDLELKNLDFFKEEHLKEDFIKLNPDHTAPTLVDGDFVLWESRAIMRYLVNQYGGHDNKLYPKDPKKRALVDRLLDFDIGTLYKSLLEGIARPFRTKNPATKEQTEAIWKSLQRLDDLLQGKQYITGDDVTLADLSLVVAWTLHVISEDDFSKYTNIAAWCERLKDLPYYTEINQPFFDVVAQMKAAAAAEKTKA